MFLTDFAAARGLKANTVAVYINNHPEIAEHTSMVGKFKVLDEVAIELLDKKYPLPKPVQVIEDTESRKKLVEAQQTIILMQQKMLEMAAENKELALKAEKVLMLEAAEQEKAETIGKLEAEIEYKNDKIDEEHQAHQTTAAELADTQRQLSEARLILDEFYALPWYKKAFWKKK